jgi:hypothetical protein
MRRGLKLTAFTALTILMVNAGCSGSTTGGPQMPDPVGGMLPTDPKNPDPSQPKQPTPPSGPSATYNGTYECSSQLDLTQNGVLPGVTGPILNALSRLKDCPGASVVLALDIAHHGLIPGSFNTNPPVGCPTSTNFARNLIVGFLNQLITDQLYNNVPLADQIATLLDGLGEMFKYPALVEDVKVGIPDASMGVDVEQQVVKVSIKMFGTVMDAPLTAAQLPAAYAKTRGTVTPTAAPIADANFSFQAAPMLVIPIGTLAYQIASPIVFAPFGATNLQGALTNIIDCTSLTSNISNDPTYAWLAPFANAACQAMIAAAALEVETLLNAGKIDASQMDTVTGKMYDVTAKKPQIDYYTDKIDMDVTWKLSSATLQSKLTGERL